MKNELTIALVGIIAVFLLEAVALLKGLNGAMFGTASATIGGIAGYLIKAHLHSRRK